jgi:hypothetical protein
MIWLYDPEGRFQKGIPTVHAGLASLDPPAGPERSFAVRIRPAWGGAIFMAVHCEPLRTYLS